MNNKAIKIFIYTQWFESVDQMKPKWLRVNNRTFSSESKREGEVKQIITEQTVIPNNYLPDLNVHATH